MVDAKELGARIRAARKAAGLTQETASDKLGVDQTSISRWELGSVALTVAQLQHVATAYGCTIADLTAPSSNESGEHSAVDEQPNGNTGAA